MVVAWIRADGVEGTTGEKEWIMDASSMEEDHGIHGLYT